MKNIVLFILVSLLITSCKNSLNEHIKEFALKNSTKIETIEFNGNKNDLSSLKQIVGDAEVVCLGESRHDIHEQFEIKKQFIKYLIEELGFTTIALEGSLPYSNRINNYILNGKGNIDQIMAEMPGWFLWDTKEIKELFLWLKKYNLNAKNKINFFGIDIVAPNDGLTQIFDYLYKVDSPFSQEINNKYFAQNIINDNQWQSTFESYSQLTQEEKEKLIKNYNELYNHIHSNKSLYISNSSLSDYVWILQLTYSVREANNMFTSDDRIKMGLIRDNAMANNSVWIKNKNDKMIIWAHNVHIAKSEFVMSMFPETKIKGMGYILNQNLNEKLVSIGASFNKGEFENENRTFQPAEPNSIDGMLSSIGMEYFIFNLHKQSENEKIKEWFNQEQSMRGQEFEVNLIPNKAFDAIFFTNSISKVKYNPITLEKIK